MSARGVRKIIDSVETYEGAGFLVHRSFPTNALPDLDPFLLLDEMGPMELGPGEAKGAPDHPHRGFETVTYMIDGRMQHRDSAGNAGEIGPGDVQWMTAGAGVVHSEMPHDDLLTHGGRMHGFQLWVNLPRRDKMMAPRYQEVPASSIPVGRSEDGLVTVRVIAGESYGQTAVIDTRTPILHLHFDVEPEGEGSQPVPAGYSVFAYVIEGSGRFGREGKQAATGQVIVFDNDGDEVQFAASDSRLSFLLIGGVPIGEPIVRYGPFVMNSKQEIHQAIDDYQNGRMGRIG
ncbi:MAG TPA: pirin family protein [Thermoanaerobaculia bacterium]|nr:pirin family protein [Thermoanaerobaculia bacterium]